MLSRVCVYVRAPHNIEIWLHQLLGRITLFGRNSPLTVSVCACARAKWSNVQVIKDVAKSDWPTLNGVFMVIELIDSAIKRTKWAFIVYANIQKMEFKHVDGLGCACLITSNRIELKNL